MANLPSQPKPNQTSDEFSTNGSVTSTTAISPKTDALVEQSMANEPEDVKRETKELVEALKSRAQGEFKGAQQVTLDMYLGAVRRAKDTLANNRMFEPAKIERSMNLIQTDAKKNMNSVLEEIKELSDKLGDRLEEAAKAAWDTFKHSGDKA